ncbi:hypothetical protein BDK51DRAFT_41459 [Blyttiomyces helicus]|uniref:Uncharacterized protein n=1 Tax=Blyttiomyces helicus TaxID=388810 RepID=A0A4P9WMW2_9FUNG|nr:hypothetical protein BDK51DRAFT_41459 [Blyttiomyces helicus]|eukprot:RKO94409.1 hypothetical protein BDK51DRAFT_41459 [Blyttiomyces helicus]
MTMTTSKEAKARKGKETCILSHKEKEPGQQETLHPNGDHGDRHPHWAGQPYMPLFFGRYVVYASIALCTNIAGTQVQNSWIREYRVIDLHLRPLWISQVTLSCAVGLAKPASIAPGLSTAINVTPVNLGYLQLYSISTTSKDNYSASLEKYFNATLPPPVNGTGCVTLSGSVESSVLDFMHLKLNCNNAVGNCTIYIDLNIITMVDFDTSAYTHAYTPDAVDGGSCTQCVSSEGPGYLTVDDQVVSDIGCNPFDIYYIGSKKSPYLYAPDQGGFYWIDTQMSPSTLSSPTASQHSATAQSTTMHQTSGDATLYASHIMLIPIDGKDGINVEISANHSFWYPCLCRAASKLRLAGLQLARFVQSIGPLGLLWGRDTRPEFASTPAAQVIGVNRAYPVGRDPIDVEAMLCTVSSAPSRPSAFSRIFQRVPTSAFSPLDRGRSSGRRERPVQHGWQALEHSHAPDSCQVWLWPKVRPSVCGSAGERPTTRQPSGRSGLQPRTWVQSFFATVDGLSRTDFRKEMGPEIVLGHQSLIVSGFGVRPDKDTGSNVLRHETFYASAASHVANLGEKRWCCLRQKKVSPSGGPLSRVQGCSCQCSPIGCAIHLCVVSGISAPYGANSKDVLSGSSG